MRLGLVVLLSLAVCAADTSGNESEVYIPPPFFDGGENLSCQNCGDKTTLDQWGVFLKNILTEDYCYEFVAISQRTIFGPGYCPFAESELTDLRVFPKKCRERETEEECIRLSVKVLGVIEIAINPTDRFKFKIWITEEMPSEVTPICLFNRDNVMDLQLQRESPYFEWSILGTISSDPAKVTGQSNCSRHLSSTDLRSLEFYKIPIQNMLCVQKTDFNSDYLINLYKGRYFLRGVKYSWRRVYIDILAYIDVIARNANDISALRPIPEIKQSRGFTAPNNLSFPNCGRKRENDDSSGGDHPWHAYIENEVTGEAYGGTLISPTVVLTAAHCLHGSKAEDLTVVVGIYDKRQRKAPSVQRRKPSRLITHPKYDAAELISDVGLMILNETMEITDNVRPICLWNDDSDPNLDHVAGTDAMAVGFGLVDNHTQTDVLQGVRLPIRAHKECYLSKRGFFGKYLRPGDNLCAGYTNGTTPCNGDSGGSLSVEKDGRWFIRGLVGFGKEKKVMFEGKNTSLCHPDQFSLFADVASHMDWIVENTPDVSFRN
ncbi:CLIP domain-containing serine protease B10-like [Cloeon dipterum]|uniref:CLIP domain-containing serine protease B10-like n=1 Tax=Cloeon dipterum TaxID=197152 RepID=UPI003220325C